MYPGVRLCAFGPFEDTSVPLGVVTPSTVEELEPQDVGVGHGGVHELGIEVLRDVVGERIPQVFRVSPIVALLKGVEEAVAVGSSSCRLCEDGGGVPVCESRAPSGHDFPLVQAERSLVRRGAVPPTVVLLVALSPRGEAFDFELLVARAAASAAPTGKHLVGGGGVPSPVALGVAERQNAGDGHRRGGRRPE